MSLRSFRYTSLKCMSLYALSQFHICKVSEHMQMSVHKHSFQVIAVVFMSVLSIITFFLCPLLILLSIKNKPDFSNILSHFRARGIKLLQKWENYISLDSEASSVCPFLCVSSLISLLWLLSCAVTEENWLQFCLLLSIWVTWGKVWEQEKSVSMSCCCNRW